MNLYKKIACVFVVMLGMTTIGCTTDFEDLNTDPESRPEVEPQELFYSAQIQMLTSAHCWNAIYASKYRWMQYGTGIWGYNLTQYSYFNNAVGNTIYDEYNEMGSYVTHINYLSNLKTNADDYSNLVQASRILLIAKGIQTSDLFGSLAYSGAWLAREGKIDDESLSPEFQTQEELSTVWDDELKACVEKLKAKLGSSEQLALKGQDRAYNGDMKKWIKAANAIRLRLASRLWKRKPDVALRIAKEVLAPANADYVFSSNDDSFILWFDNLYTNVHGGDWHSVKDMEIATYALMNYLKKNEDPRKRMYFVINNLTPENIKEFNKQQTDPVRLIPETYTRWEGATASYDNRVDGAIDRPYNRYYLTKGTEQIDMRPANTPQVRLWKGNDTDGSGGNWAPVMTYADFCFLAAEFVLREKISSSKTAKEWYENGVRASLDQWNAVGKFCDIANYEAMTEEEIAVFLAKPDIQWDETKALEQIYSQVYIEQYKNVDEMYAFWKRTNYPNWETAKIIRFEQPVIEKTPRKIPRRVKFVYPNDGVHNYENLKKRLDVMVQDQQFGGIQNEHGRLWWDVE